MKTLKILGMSVTLFILAPIFACTGLQLESKDGVFINGRTVEFGTPIHVEFLVMPRQYEFNSYRSKYAAIGADMENQGLIVDGLNEAGLSVGTFYFPGYAQYATTQSKKSRSLVLSPIEFPNWLLSQFATVDEVKSALKQVAIAPIIFKAWGIVPPFHYVVYDKTGKSLVIEPLHGELVYYDNPLGVMSNSPDFNWHITNLRNYLNLSPINVSQKALKGVVFKSFGQGSGMVGLPGDFTPPSRFIRAVFFSSSAVTSNTAKETVFQVFHLLNQFDIPLGAVRSKDVEFKYEVNTCKLKLVMAGSS